MDKLELVARTVDLIFPIKECSGLRTANTQGAPTFQTGVQTHTHNTLVNGCQLLVQHSTFTVVSGTLFRCACTHSAQGTGIQRWRNLSFTTSFAEVMVVRGLDRLSLLVRWLCDVYSRA